MSITGIEREPSPALEAQVPIFVFFKVSHHPEALPRGLPMELAKLVDGDLHSQVWLDLETEREFGSAEDSFERRERFRGAHAELGVLATDSLEAERSVFLDTLLMTTETRKPFIEIAHGLGAETVALNVRTDKNLRTARSHGLDSRQKRAAEYMRNSQLKWAKPREGIDHVLNIEDRFNYQEVLKQVIIGLERSRRQKPRQAVKQTA